MNLVDAPIPSEIPNAAPSDLRAKRRRARGLGARLFLWLTWPIAIAFRGFFEACAWFQPRLAWGRRVFSDEVRRRIERAEIVEVYYANMQTGTREPTGFYSSGMTRVESRFQRWRVIRSVLKANRESWGGFLCLDAEYGVRFISSHGWANLTICFDCMKVWVKTDKTNDGNGDVYPISGRPMWLLEDLLDAAGVPQPARDHIVHTSRNA